MQLHAPARMADSCAQWRIAMQLRGTGILQAWQQQMFPAACSPTFSWLSAKGVQAWQSSASCMLEDPTALHDTSVKYLCWICPSMGLHLSQASSDGAAVCLLSSSA